LSKFYCVAFIFLIKTTPYFSWGLSVEIGEESDEISLENLVQVYPNPFRDEVKLKLGVDFIYWEKH